CRAAHGSTPSLRRTTVAGTSSSPPRRSTRPVTRVRPGPSASSSTACSEERTMNRRILLIVATVAVAVLFGTAGAVLGREFVPPPTDDTADAGVVRVPVLGPV